MTSAGPIIGEPLASSFGEKYQVIRKLASGGMGDVYLARQVGPVAFNRLVVLKSLHPGLLSDPDSVTMFLNEAQLIASLAHPNIVHVYELLQEPSGYMIAMEYVKGCSVLELVRECRLQLHTGLPYGPALRIASSVCDALYYAYHERGDDDAELRIIHRDVSPSNILVGHDGQIKLVDFGIAKALTAEPLTKTTTIKGKSGYLAPEQVRTLPLDHRCDIFALGVVLWEITVGERLFRRDNDLQTMNAILVEPYPRPSTRVVDYPRALEEIVMTAMARDRDDRYQDAASLATDLRAVAHDHGWDLGTGPLARLVDELTDVDEHLVIEPAPGTTPVTRSRRDGSGRRGAGLPSVTPGRSGSGSIAAQIRALEHDNDLLAAGSGAPSLAEPLIPWRTVVVMLILSAVFWLLVVPRI